MTHRGDEGETLEAGPGSALDRLVESQTGRRPEDVAPGQPHATPGDVIAAEGHEAHEMSEHSFWPILTAGAMLVIGIGLLADYLISAVGVIMLLAALIGWLWQPWTTE